MVFDKTGTLTEDCLQMIGVRAVSGNISNKDSLRPYFVDFVADLKMAKKALQLKGDIFNEGELKKEKNRIQLAEEAMACCHSLTYARNDLVGDPLEV